MRKPKTSFLEEVPRPATGDVMALFYGGVPPAASAPTEAPSTSDDPVEAALDELSERSHNGAGSPQAGLSERSDKLPESSVRSLALADVAPDPRQPRKTFDPAALEELEASIREHGLLQPIVVRSGGAHAPYTLVAGERRWRSCRALGWERIEAVVLHVDEARAFELAVAENVHRNSLLPLEEAAAYQQIQTDRGLSQADLARHLGVDRRRVSEKLSLLRLPDEVKALLSERSDTFTELYGLTLAAAPPGIDVVALARRTVEMGWSLRRLREELAKLVAGPAVNKPGGVRRTKSGDGLLTMRIVPTGGFVLRVSATSDEDALQALGELQEALRTLKKRFVSVDNNQPATRRDQGKKRSTAINT